MNEQIPDIIKELITRGEVWQADSNSICSVPNSNYLHRNSLHSDCLHSDCLHSELLHNDSISNDTKLYNQDTPYEHLQEQEELALPSGGIHEWIIDKESSNRGRNIPPLLLASKVIQRSILASAILSSSKDTTPSKDNEVLKYVLWIGRECWPTPNLLARLKISDRQTLLDISLFIEPRDPSDNLWCIDTALRSKGIAAVIAPWQPLRFNLSQRFSIAAKSGGTIGLFIGAPKKRVSKDSSHLTLPRSAATTSWMINSVSTPKDSNGSESSCWQMSILRKKGGVFPEYRRPFLFEIEHHTLRSNRYEKQNLSSAIPTTLVNRAAQV